MSRQGRRGGRRGGRDRAIRSALEDHEDHLQFVHVSLRPPFPFVSVSPQALLEVGDRAVVRAPLTQLLEREEQIRDRKDISLEPADRVHALAWRATSANMVKMKLKLLSAGIFLGVILRMII